MLIVVALGGNAVSLPGKEGNIADQFAATRGVVAHLSDLVLAGHRLILTHGNGPQVGNIMRRVEIAAQLAHDRVYPLPLDIAVADTQAGMGYMIAQCFMNHLATLGVRRLVTTVVTTVRVDASDPAFNKPDKPVGPFMTREIAERHARDDGWNVREDSGRGWRRVVPSPRPREIVELPLLRNLLDAGELVVAAGGGGIPVARDDGGAWRGIEAVIDKDRTSALMAAALGADRLIILTNVDRVQKDFGKPTASGIEVMNASEAEALLAAGQFGAGSMAPKVEAGVDFVRGSTNPSAECLITSCERAEDGFAGRTGTRIVHG